MKNPGQTIHRSQHQQHCSHRSCSLHTAGLHTPTSLWLLAALSILLAVAFTGSNATAGGLKKKAKAHKAAVGFDRLITLGVGVQGGYFHAGGSHQPDDSSRATFGVQLHLRLLKVFGFSVMYDFNDAASIVGDSHMPYPSMRLTGHLYLAQLGPVHLNILAGVGFNFGEQNNGQALSAYILGVEACFQLHPRLVIIAGFHFALPSFEQVSQAAESAPDATTVSVDAQDPPGAHILDTTDVLKKIFDFRNFNVGLSARFFL